MEDEFGLPTNKWAVYEEKTTKDGNASFFDTKIVKIFPSPYHARNWMENDGKTN